MRMHTILGVVTVTISSKSDAHTDLLQEAERHSSNCLFELMLYATENSYGHVGTLSPFYGTFTQNKDAITSKLCFKYNHPSEPERPICIVVVWMV